MAQLRQDYAEFTSRNAEVLVVGPENATAFKSHWKAEQYPFVGLPDPQHVIADLYNQQVKYLKFGRMPAMMVIDKAGRLRYLHYGDSMRDIPQNWQILKLLDQLNRE